eukprot:m.161393 g.161393  ORF g.161393 m.161393 type:complete len:293 (-) comp12071_c0_seq1:140-1018(-)
MGGSASRANVLPSFDRAHPHFKHFIEVGPGLYNFSTDFHIKNVLNIYTHMSVARLSNDKYVAIDAVELPPAAKAELDELTSNGDKLVACIQTHPFHTLAIPSFHAAYPANDARKYIGCPRHLRKVTEDTTGAKIEWSGDLNEASVRAMFEPDLEMRIPAGGEFVDPRPAKTNHFSSVFVFHPTSKTVHVDDTVSYMEKPGFLVRRLVSPHSMNFHPAMMKEGLYPTKEAPLQFIAWFNKMLDDWDFDHMVTAHMGACYNDAKTMARQLMKDTEPALKKLSEKNAEAAAKSKE